MQFTRQLGATLKSHIATKQFPKSLPFIESGESLTFDNQRFSKVAIKILSTNTLQAIN